MSESSESGALSLSSAVRHIDFHLLRLIYVALVAHSIALSLHYLVLTVHSDMVFLICFSFEIYEIDGAMLAEMQRIQQAAPEFLMEQLGKLFNMDFLQCLKFSSRLRKWK